MRQNLDKEQDAQKWQQSAQALHSFYISKAIYSEALAIAEKIHAKSNTALSAAQLAETQLTMGKNEEATRTLAELDPEKAIPATKALHAIALARQGQLQEARQIGAGITGTIPNDLGTLYSLARMHAAFGNDGKALTMLADCFAAIPPSRLDNLKQHAKQSPDFVHLAGTPGFAKTLKTESKVAESKCSGGSSCAGCPMRGKCAMSQGG
ncbi:MAG: hypothetical protein JW829_05125 [Pirellulales bacterium]|nr:hypothetical protein [Pirellulales bacterium]